MYTQKITQFSNIRRGEFPITAFISDLADDIKTWKTKEDQIILMGEINEKILSKTIRDFTSKLGLRELITDRHESLGPRNTRGKKEADNRWNMGITGYQNLSRRVSSLSIRSKIRPHNFVNKNPTSSCLWRKNPPLRSTAEVKKLYL